MIDLLLILMFFLCCCLLLTPFSSSFLGPKGYAIADKLGLLVYDVSVFMEQSYSRLSVSCFGLTLGSDRIGGPCGIRGLG